MVNDQIIYHLNLLILVKLKNKFDQGGDVHDDDGHDNIHGDDNVHGDRQLIPTIILSGGGHDLSQTLKTV